MAHLVLAAVTVLEESRVASECLKAARASGDPWVAWLAVKLRFDHLVRLTEEAIALYGFRAAVSLPRQPGLTKQRCKVFMCYSKIRGVEPMHEILLIDIPLRVQWRLAVRISAAVHSPQMPLRFVMQSDYPRRSWLL